MRREEVRMSNKLLEVVRNIDSIFIKASEDRWEVRGWKVPSLRYEEIGSVRLGKGPTPKRTLGIGPVARSTP